MEGEAQDPGGTHLETEANRAADAGGRAAARGDHWERIAEAPFGSEEGNGRRERMEGRRRRKEQAVVPRRV